MTPKIFVFASFKSTTVHSLIQFHVFCGVSDLKMFLFVLHLVKVKVKYVISQRLITVHSCNKSSPWRCSAVPTAVHNRRHPVSTKTAVFFIRRSTHSCCQTAYYWTSRLPCRWCSHMERPTCRCHLSTISSHLQKTTKTASVSTFISWPCFINNCFSVWSLW